MTTNQIGKISVNKAAAFLETLLDNQKITHAIHTPAQQNTQLHWVQHAPQSQQVSQQITSYPQCKLWS